MFSQDFSYLKLKISSVNDVIFQEDIWSLAVDNS